MADPVGHTLTALGLLSMARLVQQGGGAVLQVMLGLFQAGALVLLIGPIVAGLGAADLLARPAPHGGWPQLWRQPLKRLKSMALHHRDFPLFNTPHAFVGALQDTLALVLIAAWAGDAAAGFWALCAALPQSPCHLAGRCAVAGALPHAAASGQCHPGTGAGAAQHAGPGRVGRPMATVLLLGGRPCFLSLAPSGTVQAHWPVGLSLYIALHFIASPLSVVTLAWRAQP